MMKNFIGGWGREEILPSKLFPPFQEKIRRAPERENKEGKINTKKCAAVAAFMEAAFLRHFEIGSGSLSRKGSGIHGISNRQIACLVSHASATYRRARGDTGGASLVPSRQAPPYLPFVRPSRPYHPFSSPSLLAGVRPALS